MTAPLNTRLQASATSSILENWKFYRNKIFHIFYFSTYVEKLVENMNLLIFPAFFVC